LSLKTKVDVLSVV
jgi:hypothetical protein